MTMSQRDEELPVCDNAGCEDAHKSRRRDLWTRTFLFALSVMAFIALVMMASCVPADAQTLCRPHKETLADLQEKYHEHVVAGGVTQAGTALEITAAESGTWTIIESDPNTGLTCPRAAGQGWDMEGWKPGKET